MPKAPKYPRHYRSLTCANCPSYRIPESAIPRDRSLRTTPSTQPDYFTFIIGSRPHTQFRIPQYLIWSRCDRPFYTHCTHLAETHHFKHILFPDISAPIFAVFLQVLEGKTPPPTPRGWKRAAMEASERPLDWASLEEKSVAEYTVDLYVFARDYDIRLLSRRTRRWVLAAVEPRSEDAVSTVAYAVDRVLEGRLFSRSEDKVIRDLVAAYVEDWVEIPFYVRNKLPTQFLLRCLRTLMRGEEVEIVSLFQGEGGKIRMKYWGSQGVGIERRWEGNAELVGLSEWFAIREPWEWKVDSELDAVEGALLGRGQARVYPLGED